MRRWSVVSKSSTDIAILVTISGLRFQNESSSLLLDVESVLTTVTGKLYPTVCTVVQVRAIPAPSLIGTIARHGLSPIKIRASGRKLTPWMVSCAWSPIAPASGSICEMYGTGSASFTFNGCSSLRASRALSPLNESGSVKPPALKEIGTLGAVALGSRVSTSVCVDGFQNVENWRSRPCRGGWAAVLLNLNPGRVRVKTSPTARPYTGTNVAVTVTLVAFGRREL
mmetsp:Transcript_11490/g.26164  ORF Transcript_11490/g.26164 Transcript_11490/m.26164 type:complete len:226 (+) Transcript_11490:1361-2038(+)